MNKKQLSERDICTKFITPSLRQAGWDEITQLREEVSFTKGRIIVRGKLVTRGKAKRADCIQGSGLRLRADGSPRVATLDPARTTMVGSSRDLTWHVNRNGTVSRSERDHAKCAPDGDRDATAND